LKQKPEKFIRFISLSDVAGRDSEAPASLLSISQQALRVPTNPFAYKNKIPYFHALQ
jgi:hypothetical protein